jgi:hypothetical protein
MARPCQDISRLERANVDVAYATSLPPDAAPGASQGSLGGCSIPLHNPTSCAWNETPLPHLPPPERRPVSDPLVGPQSYDPSAPEENPGRRPTDQTKGLVRRARTCKPVSRRSARRLWAWAEPWYPGLAKLFLEQLRDNLITVYIYPHANIRPMARIPLPLKDPTLETFRPRVGRIVCSLVSLHGSV